MKWNWTFTMSMVAIATFAVACGSSGSNQASQAAPTPPVTASQPTATAMPTASHPKATAMPTASRPTATTSVAGSALAPKEFISKRYGFRVSLTDEWSGQDASVDWDGAFLQGTESSAFANFPDNTIDRTLVVGAAPTPKGTKLAQWQAAMVAARPSGCSDSSSVEKTTLGGEPALSWATVCQGHANVFKLGALHGGRGYIFFVASSWNLDKAADRRTFDSIRQSFRFTS